VTSTLIAATMILCSAQTMESWQQGWNLNALPVKACIMKADNGAYRCSRKDGCLRCGPYACPELGIKGAS
jgi:hypothetical protein